MLLPATLLAFHSAITAAAVSRTIRRSRALADVPFLDGESAAPPGLRPDGQPAVDVVIPVRNEEHNLPGAVRAALSLSSARIRVLIVDDESTDATVEIARALERDDPRVRLVHAGALPPGWVGKNHACQRGAALATSEWLLFIDADVRVSPDALAVASDFAASHSIDVLSLSPRQRVEGFWETLIQPLVFELLGELYDMRKVNDCRSEVAAANGQFFMIRSSAYAKVGGHAAVRGEIVEDVALARRAKTAGLRLYFANTRTLAEARMYRGLAELWRGWRKNLYTLLGTSMTRVLWIVTRETILWVLPVVTFVASLRLAAWGGSVSVASAVSGAVALVSLAASAALTRRAGALAGRHALLVPLGKLILVAMVLASAYRTAITGGVAWKGRRY